MQQIRNALETIRCHSTEEMLTFGLHPIKLVFTSGAVTGNDLGYKTIQLSISIAL